MESPTSRKSGEFHLLSPPSFTFPHDLLSFQLLLPHRCCGSIIKIGSTVSLPVSPQLVFHYDNLLLHMFIIVLSWFIVTRKLDVAHEYTLKVESNRIFSHYKYLFWRLDSKNIWLLRYETVLCKDSNLYHLFRSNVLSPLHLLTPEELKCQLSIKSSRSRTSEIPADKKR